MYPDSLRYEPSRRTPGIIMEPGEIFIMGRSIPEDPGNIYKPVLEWISGYIQDSIRKTSISLGFEYINTSSTKWIYSIIKEFSVMKELAANADVTWYYEHGDDDMCELGQILGSLTDCHFRLVEVEYINRSGNLKVVQDHN
jgi:hypothetical protein